MHLKKNQIVKTPYGQGRIIKFPMLMNFQIGVQVKVGDKLHNVSRSTVEQWQEEEHEQA